MKKIIILMCIIFSLNIFSERYTGGYVDEVWYPFYRNTLNERICLEPNGGALGGERKGCTDFGLIGFKGDVTIIGVAEIKAIDEYSSDKLLFKVSDFKIIDKKCYVYTPFDYPSERKDKTGKFIPLFGTYRTNFMKNLKDKKMKIKYTGKNWEEDYYIFKDSSEVAPVSVVEQIYSKKELAERDFIKKKVKFLGVEKMKLDINITTSYYGSDANYLCIDFSNNIEGC